MVSTTLQSQFNDSKLLNINTVTVKVEMNPSKLCDKLADELTRDMSRIGELTGIKDIGMGPEDILKYLKTLVWLRVSLVNNDRSKALLGYASLRKRIAIPVMFYQCLISMGMALDRDYSIRFIPVYSIDSEDLLSPETMQEISDMMVRMEPNGLKLVQGIPKEPEGELDFMALSHVEETVLGYKRSHPVYGFLASFFAQHSLNEITGTMCRVIYGYESDYQSYVSSIYYAMTK